MQRDSFIFYRSFFEATKKLPKKEKLEIFEAICEFSFNNSEKNLSKISESIFFLIKPQLEANIKKYENGKKGGRPTRYEKDKEDENQTITKLKPNNNQTITKSKANVNVNVNVNENDNVVKKEKEKEKEKNDLKFFENQENKEKDLRFFTKNGVDILDVIHRQFKDWHSDNNYKKEILRLGPERFYQLLKEFCLANHSPSIHNLSAYFTKSLKEV